MYVEYNVADEDVAEIKAIQNIDSTVTAHDAYIRTMLPLLLESVMAYTNNNFDITSEGVMRIPGGVKIYIAKAIERNGMQTGLKSRSMGSVSYSYDTSVPDELKGLLAPYKKVRFHASR